MSAKKLGTGGAASVLQIERVPHVPRGMIRWNIQGVEIVALRFDMRPLGPDKAHAAQDAGHLLHRLGQRMQSSDRRRSTRQRQVQLHPGDFLVERAAFKFRLESIKNGCQVILIFVGGLTELATVFYGKIDKGF